MEIEEKVVIEEKNIEHNNIIIPKTKNCTTCDHNSFELCWYTGKNIRKENRVCQNWEGSENNEQEEKVEA